MQLRDLFLSPPPWNAWQDLQEFQAVQYAAILQLILKTEQYVLHPGPTDTAYKATIQLCIC